MKFKSKVEKKEWLAYNVVHLKMTKPEGFNYDAGDAIEMEIGDNGPGPFTMTSLPEWEGLEFIIRIYKEHHGLTEAVSQLKAGDEVGLTEPFNTFTPKPDGIFLAGGTGITPFIAIMRKLYAEDKLKKSMLFFSNKSRKDLFLEDELRKMMGDRYQNVITSDKEDPQYYGRIDKDFLESRIKDFSKPIYVCGPPPFDEAMQKLLNDMGVESDNVSLSS